MTDGPGDYRSGRDWYACPLCGKPAPWECWFSKEGKGCHHPKAKR